MIPRIVASASRDAVLGMLIDASAANEDSCSVCMNESAVKPPATVPGTIIHASIVIESEDCAYTVESAAILLSCVACSTESRETLELADLATIASDVRLPDCDVSMAESTETEPDSGLITVASTVSEAWPDLEIIASALSELAL
jgi:hypothetical protein